MCSASTDIRHEHYHEIVLRLVCKQKVFKKLKSVIGMDQFAQTNIAIPQWLLLRVNIIGSGDVDFVRLLSFELE